jgi:hypothetical protein
MTILHNDEPIDLKHRTPDSWCCVDCGMNTAPGTPPAKADGILISTGRHGWRSEVIHYVGQRGLYRSRQRMEEGGHRANGWVPVHRLP